MILIIRFGFDLIRAIYKHNNTLENILTLNTLYFQIIVLFESPYNNISKQIYINKIEHTFENTEFVQQSNQHHV